MCADFIKNLFLIILKGCPKQFSTMTSLIVHHSVMSEMLPCTLSLSRYNPTFRQLDESNNSDGNEDSDIDGDYLDPSKDSDYELISKLRFGLMKGSNLGEEDDNYSELQDVDYESTSNSKSFAMTAPKKSATESTISSGNNNNSKDIPNASRAISATNGSQQYR